ncbi:MAG: hypothetical protein AB8C02_19110 [Halioglobus sp.]
MKNGFLGISLCIVSFFVSFQAAAMPALSISGGIEGSNPSGTFVYGWEFDVFEDTTVDALGFFDFGSDGLVERHEVGVWNAEGSLLTSVTIPAGMAAELIDGFRYMDIADVLLSAAGGYVIAATNLQVDRMILRADSISTISSIGWIESRFQNTGGPLALPNNSIGEQSYFGPNFLTNRVGTVSVPAPLMLMGFGLAAVGMFRRTPRL